MDVGQSAARLSAALTLDTPPIALTFVDQAPQNIPTPQDVVPSACTFWRQAEHGTFYAPAEAHFNCPIGTMVMGFEMPEHVSNELRELMTTMCECDYVDPDEASHIPTNPGKYTGIVYGPLAEHPTVPTVVLLWLTPRQAMLCNEAGGAAKWSGTTLPRTTGRPACAALPLSVNSGTPVMSFGCTGMRTFTEISDDRMILAIPGDQVNAFVEAAEASAAVNDAMSAFYKSRRVALADTTNA